MSPEASAKAARAAGSTRRSPGAREQSGQRRPPLSVLDRRALARRARLRRQRLLLAFSGLLVAAALGLVAAGQGMVTSQQEHLDALDQQIATAVTQTQALEVARAKLSAPSRVLGIAKTRLHMVSPSHVTYLVPVVPASRQGGAGHHRRAK